MSWDSLLEALQRWDSLVQTAVAVGTILLAFVAFYEMAQVRHERRQRNRMEVAHRLYKPLRDHLKDGTWRPGLSFTPSVPAWDAIERDAFPVSTFVPARIRLEAERLQEWGTLLQREGQRLHRQVEDFLELEAQDTHRNSEHPGSRGIALFMEFKDGGRTRFEPFAAWLAAPAHPTVEEALGAASSPFGRGASSLVLTVANQPIGGNAIARALVGKVLLFLEGDSSAHDYKRDVLAFESDKSRFLATIEALPHSS